MKLENFFITEYQDGEMLPYERYKLYNWILNSNPNNILEIGCGTCGGSTKFMSNALDKLNNGHIFCCDPSRGPSQEFLQNHPRVHYSKTTSSELINYIINEKIDIDFLFFDGPENPDIAYNDLIILENYIKLGAKFAMHDWHIGIRGYDNNASTKSVKIKEYMQSSNRWKQIEILKGDYKNNKEWPGEFDSVGMCLYEFKK